MSLLRYKSYNPFRNFMRNLKVVLKSDKSEDIKIQIIDFLLNNIDLENLNKYFYSHPVYNEKFNNDWWGLCANFPSHYSPVLKYTTAQNPWKNLIQECIDITHNTEYSINEMLVNINKSVMWFYESPRSQDWEKPFVRNK